MVSAYFTMIPAAGHYAPVNAGIVANRFQENLIATRSPVFQAARSADEADMIVLVESEKHKFKSYVPVLEENEWLRNRPESCFTYNFEDSPYGFLPGVYVSMTKTRFNADRMRAIAYHWLQNGRIGSITSNNAAPPASPSWLCSFRGSASAKIRKRLFSTTFRNRLPASYSITQTFGWFDHSDRDLQNFADEILDSKFVLCPRGIGTASHRLIETMASGRAPVILSDDWVAPKGPAWSEFAIILPESQLEQLPATIEKHQDHWAEMGRRARQAWEEWLAPEVSATRILEQLMQIRDSRPTSPNERSCQRQWNSLRFAYANGWTLPQRVFRKVRRGSG